MSRNSSFKLTPSNVKAVYDRCQKKPEIDEDPVAITGMMSFVYHVFPSRIEEEKDNIAELLSQLPRKKAAGSSLYTCQYDFEEMNWTKNDSYAHMLYTIAAAAEVVEHREEND